MPGENIHHPAPDGSQPRNPDPQRLLHPSPLQRGRTYGGNGWGWQGNHNRSARLHAKDLPGKPDLAFRPRKKVIFVHGCFWQQLPKLSCKDGRAPGSNLSYWAAKLARNVNRDQANLTALKALGYGVLVVWECEALRGGAVLERRLRRFLG